jgi:hypothetical protein
MSEVRLAIRDARREIYGDQHGGFAEAVVAALSAEPETIEELELAMERFAAPPREGHFHFLRPGLDDQPHDAGVVVIDLAARLVAAETSYFDPGSEGHIDYHDGQSTTDGSALRWAVRDRPDRKVVVTVHRRGKDKKLDVTLGTREGAEQTFDFEWQAMPKEALREYSRVLREAGPDLKRELEHSDLSLESLRKQMVELRKELNELRKKLTEKPKNE